MTTDRPDPEVFLARAREEQSTRSRGRLKVFFGAVAGVGKTYSMLQAARAEQQYGKNVLVGYVETHGRQETEALLDGLQILPRKTFQYRGTSLEEFDLDSALAQKPELILVDELAHSNAPGARHHKRWQDVQELLDAGIDVFTTLNVQHIESLHDVVAQITGVSVKERVPDSFLEQVTEMELVDLPPDKLIQRLQEGKVYIPGQARSAAEHFFKKSNLIALRQLALRFTAERVEAQMEHYRRLYSIEEPWPAAERILVCVSPSPLSARLVRAARRMAAVLRSQWFVAFVETPGHVTRSRQEKDRVIETLRLAEQLGATVLELSGTNVAEEIMSCAHHYNVSRIIVGKPTRPRWIDFVFGNVVDEIVRASGPIDVYVITGDEPGEPELRVGKIKRTSKVSSYIAALAVVVACTLVARLMVPYFDQSNVIMVYILGVVLVAFLCGRGPSILASLLSVVAFDLFFIPPYYTFAIHDTQYVVTFAVMLVIAIVISTLTVQVRLQADAARHRERRTAALYSMSRELASSIELGDLIETGLRHTGEVFGSKAVVYLPDERNRLAISSLAPSNQPWPGLDDAVASWVYQNNQSAGLNTATLPGASALYIPLRGSRRPVGVLAVEPSEPSNLAAPERLHLLETFANQIALACERAFLSEETERSHLKAKTEQLRSSLLSSISHDLRTPLATISGAASSIIDAPFDRDPSDYKSLAREIYDESARLNRLLGNLLDMTKVDSGALKLNRDWYPVDQIVGAALSHTEHLLGARPVKTSIPRDLKLIHVDDLLMQQVLVNLLDNAVKYAGKDTPIDIEVTAGENDIIITVADRGPGIAEEDRERIFEKFYRADPSGSPGVGLGLSICQGIVEAHSGRIWVEPRPGGGSIFKISLPLTSGAPSLDEMELRR